MPRIALRGKMVKLLQIDTQHEKHPSCPETSAAVSVGVSACLDSLALIYARLALAKALILYKDESLYYIHSA